MSEILKEKFQKEYDSMLDIVKSYKQKKQLIQQKINNINEANPKPWNRYDSFLYTDGWEILGIIAIIAFAVSVIGVLAVLLNGEKLADMVYFLLISGIIGISSFAIAKVKKELYLQKYEQDLDKYKIKHEQDLPSLTSLSKQLADLDDLHSQQFIKIKDFVLRIYKWIKTNRKSVDISPQDLGRITRILNKYLDDPSSYKKIFDKEDYDSVYDIMFYGHSTVMSEDKFWQQTKEKLDPNYKMKAFVNNEVNKIMNNNINIKDEKDKEAVKQLVKMRVNSVDVIQDVMGVSKDVAEEIFENIEVKEEKRIANHTTFEGRISVSDKNKMKAILGTKCMACGKNLSEIYGTIGTNYIELHHKIPYSDMKENETRILNKDDFCVLCPDCHRMIHKLPNANDIDVLQRIIRLNKKI